MRKLSIRGELVDFRHEEEGTLKNGDTYSIDMMNGHRSIQPRNAVVYLNGNPFKVCILHWGEYESDSIWELDE